MAIKKKIPLLVIVRRINVPRMICQHLAGSDHSRAHRIAVGGVVMVLGVIIAKHFSGSEHVAVEYAADVVGSGIHGLGLTPIIEALLEDVEEIA